MPRRKTVLATNEIYHIFNRSIAKQEIFSSAVSLRKVIEIVDFYRFPQKMRLSKFKNLSKKLREDYLFSLKRETSLVEVYAFAFMPNHYHFLLKQIQDKGISLFISNFQNSFAKYFNIKNDRNGALFQNSFKGKRVETDEQLLHISRYIHLNPVTSYIIEFDDLIFYPYTSFIYYHKKTNNSFVNTEFLMKFFSSQEDYNNFVKDQVGYQRDLAIIKDLLLE